MVAAGTNVHDFPPVIIRACLESPRMFSVATFRSVESRLRAQQLAFSVRTQRSRYQFSPFIGCQRITWRWTNLSFRKEFTHVPSFPGKVFFSGSGALLCRGPSSFPQLRRRIRTAFLLRWGLLHNPLSKPSNRFLFQHSTRSVRCNRSRLSPACSTFLVHEFPSRSPGSSVPLTSNSP